jgi:hypothetical protein
LNRAEFTPSYERLCRGHRFETTEERAEATYRAIQHWPAVAWDEAVDVLLVDPRMPDRNRLIAAVDAADDRRRRATRPEPYLPDRLPPSAPNREYGQLRLDLAKALFCGKITKRDAAERLIELADRFPAMADTLVREAAWFADQASPAEPPPVTGNGPPIDFPGESDPVPVPSPENAPQGQIALDDPGPAPGQELSATPGPSADIVPGGAATREEPDDDANPF